MNFPTYLYHLIPGVPVAICKIESYDFAFLKFWYSILHTVKPARQTSVIPIPTGWGGVYMNPLRCFQNHSQTVCAKTLKLYEFLFLPYRNILKNFPVNGSTASYDDVITKNGGSSFVVKFLLNWKINEILMKSYLSNICTWNFECYL